MPQIPAMDIPAIHQGAIRIRQLAVQTQILQSTTARQITYITARSQAKTHGPKALDVFEYDAVKVEGWLQGRIVSYMQYDVFQPFYGHAKRSVYTLTFLPRMNY